jgi:hypothetical protein
VGLVDVPTLRSTKRWADPRISGRVGVRGILLERTTPVRLTDSFHQTIWPGELGLRVRHGNVKRQVYWGALNAVRTASTRRCIARSATPSDERRWWRAPAAAQATADKYVGKAFAYGRYDCVRMVAHHLREMGYKPGAGAWRPLRLAPGRDRGAKARRLRLRSRRRWTRSGWSALHRQGPFTGDIGKFRGPEPFGGLMIYVGNGRTLGYLDGQPGATFAQPREPALIAWRVPPMPAAATRRHVARRERRCSSRQGGRGDEQGLSLRRRRGDDCRRCVLTG